jgi:mRNA interferase RelE/StbE
VASAKSKVEVRITPAAERDLRRIDRQFHPQIDRALKSLEVTARPFNSESLTGAEKGYFRLPTGEYRIVYSIAKNNETVYVTRIRHRREAYRR